MKKFLLSAFLVLTTIASAFAQMTVPQGGTGTTTFRTGGIVIGSSTLRLSSSPAKLFWDWANSRLGVGTSTPTTTLSVDGTSLFRGNVSLPLLSDGCLQTSSNIITSTGATCGSGSGGSFSTTSINGFATTTFSFIVGTAGSDFNIATSSTAVTFNLPTASASNRGALSSTDWTTFNNKLSSAIISLNGLTGATQTFASSSSGTDFAIISSGTTHTFQLPTASASNRGLLSSADWTTFNNKSTLASFSASYPILYNNGTGVISTAFSTSTTNVFIGLNTFNATTTFATTTINGSSTFVGQVYMGNASSSALTVSGKTVLANASTTNITVNGVAYHTGDILPTTTDTYSLGNNSFRFLNLFAQNVYATSSVITQSTSTSIWATNIFPVGLSNSFLSVDVSGKIIATTTPAGSLSGGINGYLARWTSPSALSTGLLLDNATVSGVNATSSTVLFNIQGSSGTALNLLNVASSSGSSMFTIGASGTTTIQPTATSSTAFTFNTTSGNSILKIDNNAVGFTDYLFKVSTSSNNYFFAVQGNGHITASSTVPTISSCGGSPSVIVGNDKWGRILTGSGVITACTVTFVNAYTNAPICDVNPEGGITTFMAASSTPTGFLITGASTITSAYVTYQCFGVNE